MCGQYKHKMILVATILVLVSVASGTNSSVSSDANVSSDASDLGGSRMAWLKALLDHHEWADILANDTTALPPQCAVDLRLYVAALNKGELWASKMYDASGQYTSNVLFGSEYWLGSLNACIDLRLKQYYAQTPPFDTGFYIAKVNLTVDQEHLPTSRVMLVGECIPTSCAEEGLAAVLAGAERAAAARASAAGLDASIHTVGVRPVPGNYSIFRDTKFQILGSAVLLVGVLMLVSSAYEGYLERRHRLAAASRDLELADNRLKAHNNNVADAEAKPAADNKDTERDRDLRRETRGSWSELLLSFSMLSNGRTILNTDRPTDGALTCLHGMRFMSVIWVIMVHTYLTVFYVADNKTMRIVTERNFMYQSVGNASYCVDTFFFISGLLVTVLFLRTEDKKAKSKADKKKQNDKQDMNKNINGYTNSALSVSVISQQSFCEDLMDRPSSKGYSKDEIFRMTKSFFVLFGYRVVRLTPAYAFVIGLNEVALRYTHYHSVFESAVPDHITCDLFWWRNLLYINNLYPQREMCMVWSWYMANDTQFYVVGIILLLISVKHPKISWALLGLVLSTSWVTTIYISVWHQYKARIQEPFEMFDALYDKPWSRIGPYLIGMVVGWYLHKTKCKVRLPYWLVVVGWPCSIAILGSLIFGMVDGYFEVWPTAFYVSVGHTAWGVALAWIAVACCCGYGGLVNSFLSYRGLLPLSRLTYCAYLVHPTIMMYTSALLDGPLHMQNSMVLTIYAGYAVMAFLASFAISLAFEAPAVRLLKILSGGPPKNRC
ncbi:nose resistant to fluoxetine protein 6-like isoform X2 [Pectinophora gossypiella]|uniref:nose resistant to fluoxetine protein 6-like isoform X2 n=1 Tax=Pectinophora gossypiella TaxID=13191 RepID=UPI00214DF701|nr:nose resistant to fluoxetine protein 6-like isoform X2 [Pectinophora gossypiella]